MVFVKIRETYDLSTKKDKMTMLGIHTPTMAWLTRQYFGFFVNYSKFRFDHCDCVCACASTLPADPLQIGTSETDIAPQDMFNPILYRAVSNDSFDTLNSRLYTLGYFTPNTEGGSVAQSQEAFTGTDNFAIYYSILARPDGFRTASPQAGFEMHDLRPLVWEQLYTEQAPYGRLDTSAPSIGQDGGATSAHTVGALRGHARPYPSLPTFMAHGPTYTTGDSNVGMDANVLDGSGINLYHNIGDINPVYVGQILIPPSKLNLLYYRLVVEWTIEFTGVRPSSDITRIAGMVEEGDPKGFGLAYFTDYDFSTIAKSSTASLAESDTSSVSVQNGSIDLIMQA